MNQYLIRSITHPSKRSLTVIGNASLLRRVNELSGQQSLGKVVLARAQLGVPTTVACRPGSEGRERFGERGFAVEPILPGMKPQPRAGWEPYLARHVNNIRVLTWRDTPANLAVEDGTVEPLDEIGMRNVLVMLMNSLYPTSNEGDLKSMHN